jgi:hypothetical protein
MSRTEGVPEYHSHAERRRAAVGEVRRGGRPAGLLGDLREKPRTDFFLVVKRKCVVGPPVPGQPAATRSASARTEAIADSRVSPYAITPGIDSMSAQQRPSSYGCQTAPELVLCSGQAGGQSPAPWQSCRARKPVHKNLQNIFEGLSRGVSCGYGKRPGGEGAVSGGASA